MGWNRDRPRLTRWLRWLQWPLYGATAGSSARRAWDKEASGTARGISSGCGCAASGWSSLRSGGNGWLREALSYSRVVWLGKISYGLYMYHEIAIWLRKRFMYKLGWFANREELFTIATFALVIAMAALSYYAYERRFLVWKRAWTRVPSRPV